MMLTKSFILKYTPPQDFKLEQNFPNPFNPTTKIKFTIPTSPSVPLLSKEREGVRFVTLKVYDILGSEAATLVNEFQTAGFKEIKFDASSLSSGVYIYRLAVENYSSIKKMMVLK